MRGPSLLWVVRFLGSLFVGFFWSSCLSFPQLWTVAQKDKSNILPSHTLAMVTVFFFYHSNGKQRQINLGFLEDCDKYINQAFCLFFSSISLLLFQFPPSFHFHIFSSPSFPIYYCIYIPEPLTYQDKMFI